ncbi:heavy-metal-associated domain-containing protein [Desulfolucanica intricata]|uniref:heavy-metal-associated domain-containing protein n=1 Tax=Desulfolucanica intricata TaxID=1285191 RepID=UPI00082D0C3C|nr:heavy-metal-associated domain-containing protein [Desulfolucanica intricata]
MTAENIITRTYKVGGLFDEQGQKEIEHNLIQVDGVKKVDISIPEHTVAVQFDSAAIEEDWIKRTLNSLGYAPFYTK